MYTRLTKRQLRNKDVTVHEGTSRDFLGWHKRLAAQAAQKGEDGLREIGPALLEYITNTRNLRCAWDYLAEHGGYGPGPNRLRYDDFENAEIWELLRALSKAVEAGTYRPGPDRAIRIPKSSGRGHRTLRLQDIQDRVVQRGIVQIIQPLLDPSFDEDSYGYRPRRDRQHALARADVLTTTAGSGVWVVDDVEDAFDNVPRSRLFDVLRRTLPEDIVELIRVVSDNDSKRGIRQGSPLSPLLLNVYLDHFLDKPWKVAHPDHPLLRTADDILVECRDLDSARAAYADLGSRCRTIGLALKGTLETAICDLAAGDRAEWLGFDVCLKDRQLEVRHAERAWEKLADELGLAHTKPNSPLLAIDIINGWIDQSGPCYSTADSRQAVDRVAEIAGRLAFDEIPPADKLLRRWQKAAARYKRLRRICVQASA